jgi:hypothetical protein
VFWSVFGLVDVGMCVSARFWCAEIVEAISYLHTQLGIVWRDCKPDNVMIDSEGHVKLIDFGVSALLTLPASSDASATNPQTRIVTGAHRRHQSSITIDQVDEQLQPVEGLTGAIGAMGCVWTFLVSACVISIFNFDIRLTGIVRLR